MLESEKYTGIQDNEQMSSHKNDKTWRYNKNI